MIHALSLAALIACALAASAQEGSLDVLDGETLYEGGWLLTLGYELEQREGLRSGSGRVSDPLNRELIDQTVAFGAHYGLRYDVQLSAIIPYISRKVEFDDPSGPDRIRAEGFGDAAFVVKWRYYRWDDVGKALNFAVLGGVEVPTGDDDVEDHGVRVPSEFQPGSGSWDASLGTAVTYEPGRWRFNTALLYQRNGQGAEDFKFGDELFGEIAVGNRFWLEPYPGPFMRFDALLRFRRQWRSTQGGEIDHDSGGDWLTVGATLAFRPRPTLDFQIFVEYPVLQNLEGTQLEEDLSVFFAIGFRI